MKNNKKNPVIWRSALGLLVVYIVAAVLLGFLLFGGEDPLIDPWLAEPEPTPAPQLDTHPVDTRPIVVIDAGHGGHDPGAVDATGTITEAETNAEMAARVMALLARHEGELLAVPAHEWGTYETPLFRANTASSMGADLMVSLHLNADLSEYTRGFSVYPTPPGRVYHEESLRFAQLLLRQVSQLDIPIMGETGVWYAYYYPIYGGGYNKITTDAAWEDPQNPRSVESFGVVEYTGCPAVLVEQWHISNQQDMAMLYNEEGFDKMARCIYVAICEYFEIIPDD